MASTPTITATSYMETIRVLSYVTIYEHHRWKAKSDCPTLLHLPPIDLYTQHNKMSDHLAIFGGTLTIQLETDRAAGGKWRKDISFFSWKCSTQDTMSLDYKIPEWAVAVTVTQLCKDSVWIKI